MTQTNAADRKQVRAAEKAAAIAERERAEVIVALMSTTAGRKFAWDKLGDAHIFASVFSTDPLQMAFNEGQRNQGLALLDDIIRSCPDQFILAMREANGRRTADDIRTANRDNGQRAGGEEPGRVDEGYAGAADADDGDESGGHVNGQSIV